MKASPPRLAFLDHVALRVSDMEQSTTWYEQTLGLRRIEKAAWHPFPILMMAGMSGVALFPRRETSSSYHTLPSLRIDHFAFRVNQQNFAQAKTYFEQNGISYEFQDHTYFHSIYLRDPDGHLVELTCIQVEEEAFFSSASLAG